MRVRIKKDYMYTDVWDVQVKYWWSTWITNRYFSGDGAESRALEAARGLLNPTIIEVL